MRQKIDIVLIVLSVIFLLVIAGCEGGSKDAAGKAPATPFIGGSQGLAIGFLEGSPPEEVTDGGAASGLPFQAVVRLTNLGEYKFTLANQIKVSLEGFLPGDFNPSAEFLDTDLQGKNPTEIPTPKQRDSEGNIIEAIESYVTFPKQNTYFKYKGTVAGNTNFIFKSDVCYKYQTKAVSEICVLANQIDVANDAICDPSESKKVFSSGSPIVVTAFRQNVVGEDKAQLSFDVVHSSSGYVFDVRGDDGVAGDDVYCPKTPTQRRIKEDQIQVTVDTGLAYGTLTCPGLDTIPAGATTAKKTGIVRLVNGKRTITCTQVLSSYTSDFKRNADITIDFNYLDSISKNVLVKHLAGS